jgi:hypothetical protein
MDSDGLPRWIAALVFAIAIVLLIVFARGEPDHEARPAADMVTIRQSM